MAFPYQFPEGMGYTYSQYSSSTTEGTSINDLWNKEADKLLASYRGPFSSQIQKGYYGALAQAYGQPPFNHKLLLLV